LNFLTTTHGERYEVMLPKYETPALARLTAVTVTVAAFAKTFVPFYLIGSTAIFAGTSALGVTLAAVSWRTLWASARNVTDLLIVLALFYATVIVSYFSHSASAIPITFLLGILIFHTMFITFGFAAARALKAVLLALLGAAAIYSIWLIQYAVRFGDVMKGNYIDDIFGIGDRLIYISFHQNIGLAVGLGILAAIGLASNRFKQLLAAGALPIVLFLLFHIASRTALVALLSSLAFLGFAACWDRSRKMATLITIAAFIAVTIAAFAFYQHEIRGNDIGATAPDAISRTIQELENPNPGFRIPIWTRTLHRIVSEPGLLLFGRGVGMYPVNEGYGAPDWLLHLTEGSKHYPHDVHLEIFYETGIVGFLLFSALTFFPLIVALRQWRRFTREEQSIVSLYVFILVSSEISSAFAYSYLLQFFLALTMGTIARKRMAYSDTREGHISDAQQLSTDASYRPAPTTSG
jgi:O-antigen ligase